jgi:hypothetical protein
LIKKKTPTRRNTIMALSMDDLKKALKEAKANTGTAAEDGTEKTLNILVKGIFGSEKKSAKGVDFQLIHIEYRDLDYDSLQEKKIPMFQVDQAELVLEHMDEGKTYKVGAIKEKGYWVWKTAEEVTSE